MTDLFLLLIPVDVSLRNMVDPEPELDIKNLTDDCLSISNFIISIVADSIELIKILQITHFVVVVIKYIKINVQSLQLL
jgi:hypothetical protein